MDYEKIIGAKAAELKGIVAQLKSGELKGEDLTAAVQKSGELTNEIRALQSQRDAAVAGDDLLGKLAEGAPAQKSGEGAEAKSLGQHLALGLGKLGIKSGQRVATSLGEFKAATDPMATDTTLTELDVQNRVVRRDAWVPTVGGLFAQGTVSGVGLKYYVETPIEGDFTAVAELGHKPQLSMGYEPETESLAKIAGFIKESDEFIEDLPYLASVTNGRLLRRLAQAEETQLVSGTGTAPNLRGLLNRTGLQTLTAADTSDNAPALFRALMAVQNVTGLQADGIVINPVDYERERLRTDSNGQFVGGGVFGGQYGNGGTTLIPPLWGTRTVVSGAVPVGTAVVGAFGTAGMVFRKGGIRVDVANQNADDFEYNRVTIRAEERLGLAVYVPQAFVRVTLSATAPL